MPRRTNIRSIVTCIVALCAVVNYDPGTTLARTARKKMKSPSYALIINAKNRGGASREQVKRLFLKQANTWKNGLRAKPLDRKASDPAHRAFLANVLQMDESRFVAHWLAVKQKTGVTRPLGITSDRAVGRLVAKYEGAFGFIELKDGVDPPKGTVVLFRF